MSPNDAGLVTVATFEWLPQASVAQSCLDSAGIPSLIADDVFGTQYWHYVKTIGGLRLQVSAEDLDDARAILAQTSEPEEPILTGPEDQADRFARAAVFSVVSPPLFVCALWLLYRVFTVRAELGGRARREVTKGVAILTVYYVVLALFALLRVR